jgi:hypothetical protein
VAERWRKLQDFFLPGFQELIQLRDPVSHCHQLSPQDHFSAGLIFIRAHAIELSLKSKKRSDQFAPFAKSVDQGNNRYCGMPI